jgi:predicted CXXCH cytochrome family protein
VHTKLLVNLRWPVFAMITLMLAGACSEDTVVYQDREPFNPPADSVSGMLGYYNIEAHQTTCGNCHADTQVEWAETAHAHAWEGLQSSPGAAEFCEGCHTVGELGNALTAASGWNAVKDSTYLDVQCESCHGPGNDHVGAPDMTQPLASIAVDTGATNGCGECHEGTHHPFVEQWRMSAHSSGFSFGYAGGRDGCDECHSAQGALEQQFNSNADYVEKDGDPLTIVCAVCHDPHGGPFDSQTRAPVGEGTPRSLCMLCHYNNAVPTETTHGPHAAQGPLVLGEQIGWWPDGFEWLDGLTGSHGDTDVNERLCATCHVVAFEVTDEATGDFVFHSVGHTFEAISCLSAEGIPTMGPCTDDERDFSACAGCHGTEAASQSIYEAFKDTVNALLDQIWVDTDGNHIIDPAPTDAGVLPLILQATGDDKQIDVSDTLFTAAEGILWNAQLASTHDRELFRDGATIVIDQSTMEPDTVHFGGHAASGNGVHNPPLLEALLKATILHAIDFYGIPAPAPGFDLTIRTDRSQFRR